MINLADILSHVGASVLTAGCFFIGKKVRENSKGQKTACRIDVVIMRYALVQIYQKCKAENARTQLDTRIFYEIFEIYTKNLKQNSYICKEVEPVFKNIKQGE